MLATLTDGKTPKQFPLNPDKAIVTVSGDYAINSVLDTFKPIVRRKSSATVYKLDKILLYSFAGNVDYMPTYLTFKYWASVQTRLKYSSDIHNIASCYIKTLTMEPKRWNGEKLLQAEMTMELIEAGEEVKPGTTVVAKKSTAREQANKKAIVQKKLKVPTKQKTLKLSSNFSVEVDDQNVVAILSDGVTTEYDYDTLITQLG